MNYDSCFIIHDFLFVVWELGITNLGNWGISKLGNLGN